MRAFHLAGILAFLVLASGAATAAPGDAVDATDNGALIQFRPVVDCAAYPNAPHLSIYSPQAHCLGDAVITERDFSRLERLRLGGSPILRAQLTPEAWLKYFEATRDHLFQPMALLVEGRATQVWIVRAPSRAIWLPISGGYLTDMKAEQVANRYYAQGGRD
jgi:hypothetical protein